MYIKLRELIVTQWDVNYDKSHSGYNMCIELIVTQWNIKYDTIIYLIFLKIGYVIKQNSGFKLCAFDRINMIDKCNPLHATNHNTIPTFLTTTIGGIRILQGL